MSAKDNYELLEQAFTLSRGGKRDEALQLIREAVNKDPRDYDAWFALAKVSNNRRERYDAVEQVLRLRPDHPQARDLRATLDARKISHDVKRKVNVEEGVTAHRDYRAMAVLALAASFLVPIAFVGMIVAGYFLFEEQRVRRDTGRPGENVGCLWAVIAFNLVPMICAFVAVMALISVSIPMALSVSF